MQHILDPIKIEITTRRLSLTPDNMECHFAEALNSWETARGDRFASSLKEFDYFSLPTDLIPGMMIVDLLEPGHFMPEKTKYRFYGTKLVSVMNQELTGKSVFDYRPVEAREVLMPQYDAVMEQRGPVLYLNIVPRSGGILGAFTLLRLPLSNDGERISNIVTFTCIEREPRRVAELFRMALCPDETSGLLWCPL